MNLRSCPFCGSSNINLNQRAVVRATVNGEKMNAIRIVCVDCPAEMAVTDQDATVEAVVALWNARA